MDDKVSIIIPVYNTHKYLANCLDSVIEQTYKNLEVICIDDGSTDDSYKILEKYSSKDKRIKVFTRENKGLLFTRIDGVKKSTGKYIIFLDSDDWIDSDYVEKLYSTIIEKKCDIVRCNLKLVSDNGDILEYQNFFKNEFFDENKIKNYVFLEFCTSYKFNNTVKQIIDKKLLSEIYKVDTSISMGEDLELNMKIYNKVKSIYTIDYYGYNYRFNPNSISKTLSKNKLEKNLKDEIKVYFNLVKFIKNNNPSLIQYSYSRALTQITEHLMRFSLSKIKYNEFCKKSYEISNSEYLDDIRKNLNYMSINLIKSKKNLFIKMFYLKNIRLFNFSTYYVYKKIMKFRGYMK